VGIGVGANIMGSDARPTRTRAFIEDSTLTIGGDSLEVLAINENPTTDARIFAFGAGIGVSTSNGSIAAGVMLSVNLITNETVAYVKRSTITDDAATAAAVSVLVEARDTSGIVTFSGAVGVSPQTAIGAALSYNEIDNQVSAELEATSIDVD